MIHVRCHKCSKKYAVPDEAKGKRIRCRRCQQIIVVSEDVTDWLNAMSFAASQWQDADDKGQDLDNQPPPDAGPLDTSPSSVDGNVEAPPRDKAEPEPVGTSQDQPSATSATEPPQAALPDHLAIESDGEITTNVPERHAETDSETAPTFPSPNARTNLQEDRRQLPNEPGDRRSATRSITRLLIWDALLTTLLVAGFLLVLGLWLGGVVHPTSNRYMIAGLAGLVTAAALAAHWLAAWRIARICRDLGRRR